DDGDACTTVDACTKGACVGSQPTDCAPVDACHDAGTCQPATGACSSPAKPDGTPCPSGACANGACVPNGSAGGGTGVGPSASGTGASIGSGAVAAGGSNGGSDTSADSGCGCREAPRERGSWLGWMWIFALAGASRLRSTLHTRRSPPPALA